MIETHSSHIVIKVAENDNVGVVAGGGGLKKGERLKDGLLILQDIPVGEKVALESIAKEGEIIRYGEVIGYARQSFNAGERVAGRHLSLPEAPDLTKLSPVVKLPRSGKKAKKPLEGYTFMGYRNQDGSVGTKNVLGISTSVQCVGGFAGYIANKIRTELLPRYPNVDEVTALNHTYGCGVAINAASAAIPIRTLRNITDNPNFGGEVLVVGLGCEKLMPESLLSGGRQPDKHIFSMQAESHSGFGEMVDEIMKMSEVRLQRLNQRKREECPASDLVVGMQCGGSDIFSGLTANPAAGYAADLLVQAGGSVFFSEVTEVRDAVHLMMNRISDPEVGRALLAQMQWYDDYLQLHQTDRSANPAPGNLSGGISNIVEKALGSVSKSGTSPIVDVIPPGDKIRRKGLSFVATPASDFVCGTLQVAAGMNLHVFMTGRGTPYGLPMVPVIKISSNPKLSKRWHDLIDLDAGRIATGQKTIEETGWELFYMMLDVASGRKQVACDKIGLHNELVLFDPGPLT